MLCLVCLRLTLRLALLVATVTGLPLVSEVSHAITFLVKVLLTKERAQDADTNHEFNAANFKKLEKMFRKTLTSFLLSRLAVYL